MTLRKWTVGMGVTSVCNMNCPFCYSQDRRKVNDLSLDTWTHFMKINAPLIHSINYGTGENTLSPAWYDLIFFVRRHYPQICQALTTNGHLAKAIEDGEKKRAILECIDEIDVSIDFADPQRHDGMRGCPGAFEMAVKTLAFCKAHGIRATIVVLGHEEMLKTDNLSGLFDLASRYDAFVRINLYRHVSHKSPFWSPDLSTVLTAVDWIMAHYMVVSISERVFRSIYDLPADPESQELTSIRILPNGDITPSTYLITEEWVAGNIRHPVLLTDLDRSTPFQRFAKDEIPKVCMGCRHAETCRGGTRDRRFLTWGNLAHPDIYCPEHTKAWNGRKKCVPPRILENNRTVHSDYLPTMIFSPSKNGSGHVRA